MNSFLTNLTGVGLRVSAVIVLIALLRPWLRRGIGSRGVALLWSMLAVRLLWPGLPESRWGLLHAAPRQPVAEIARIVPQLAAEVKAGQPAPIPDAPRLVPPPPSIVLTSAPAPARNITTLEWAAGLWSLGFVVVAAYFLWHLLAARRWSVRTLPADDYPRLADAFAALPARIRGNLEVRVTRELDTPVLAGWLRPQIWVPVTWVDRLNREEWQHVLWHEAGHARRRDLPVQWIFAAACCLHWFNPLVWLLARWARDERELACDAWVCAQQAQPADFTTAYGRTLLRLVTGTRRPGPWPLAPATVAIAAGLGPLRQRLHEIAAFRPVPSWRGSAGALVGALALAAVTTVGTVSSAQETPAPPAETPAASLAAQPGTITGRVVAEKTGEPLANVLVRAAVGEHVDMHDNRSPDSGCLETRTDRNGAYRLSVPLPDGEHRVQLDALAAGYRSSAGTIMSGGHQATVPLAPGGTGKYDFKLPEALYLKGVVVDEAGQPVRDAKIEATCLTEFGGYGYVAVSRTAADGKFEVFDFPLRREEGWKAGHLVVRHRDYLSSAVANIYSLSKEEQAQLKLVLAKGKQLTGTLLDASGKPAAGVEVTACLPHGRPTKSATGGQVIPPLSEQTESPDSLLKRSVTDQEGKFVLWGLYADTDYLVTAHALALNEKYQASIRTDADHDGLTLNMTPIVLGQPLQPVEVLGMQLVDLTDELRKVYDYYESPTTGALLLDPGKNSRRLQLGELKQGQVFWLVQDVQYEGTARVRGVREFVDALIKDLRRNEDGTSTCRVAYTEDRWSTNTQYLRVTEREAADLKDLAAKLDAEQPPASPAAAATPATVPDTSGTVAKLSSRCYALQVDGKTVATLLLPFLSGIDIVSDTAGERTLTKPAPGGGMRIVAFKGNVKATLKARDEPPVTITCEELTMVPQPPEPVEHTTLVLPPGNTPGANTLSGVTLVKRTNPATKQDAWFFTGDALITALGHAPITISGRAIELR